MKKEITLKLTEDEFERILTSFSFHEFNNLDEASTKELEFKVEIGKKLLGVCAKKDIRFNEVINLYHKLNRISQMLDAQKSC